MIIANANYIGRQIFSDVFSNKYSMNLDGVDEGIISLADASINPVNDMTVSVWVKGSIGGASNCRLFDRRFIYIQHTGASRIRCRIYQTAGAFQTFETGGVSIFDGNWHHVLVSYSVGGNAKIYLDNTLLVNVGATLTGLFNSSNQIGVGTGYLGTNGYLEGNIDEPAYWHNSDQSSNIATIWNGGTPGDLSGLSPSFWLRMGDKASWDGVQWTLTQQGSSVENGKSLNMEEADRQIDTPP